MTYDDLVNDIVPETPGAPVPVIIRAIREAVRQFCRESSVYRKTLNSATDLSYASGIYTIAIPADTQILSVISPMVFNGDYTVDGTPYSLAAVSVQGVGPEWADINRAGWRSAVSSDTVENFVMLSTNTFVLTPDSGTDRKTNLTVSLVLMQDRVTTTLDTDIGNRWFDELVAGAKYLLMAMPEVPWSNPALSQFYFSKFSNGIDEARRYIETGHRQPQKASGIQHVRGYYK